MAGFISHDNTLTCDGIPLDTLVELAGTPCHVYSASLMTERVHALTQAFSSVPHRLHYALKANSTMAVVRHLRSQGVAADVNSGGELEVALRAGFAPHEIVFTGVGKTHDELDRAVQLGLAAINAESFGEIDRIATLSRQAGRTTNIAVRINPDVDAGTHPHISTGSRTTKFGVPLTEARAMIRSVTEHPGLKLVGLHMHLGSQIVTTTPLVRGARILADLARDLIASGLQLEHLDVGGGLGIPYQPGQAVLTPDDYAAAILPAVRETGLTILLEPGRWIVGPCGLILTRVVDLKPGPEDGWFVIVDAGMTDLMRPALYGAFHTIEAIRPRPGAPIHADIVGPVCETSDTLGASRTLPPVIVGDLLAVRDTGAYGAVMASNYNRRPIAPEILIENGNPRLVRRRQSLDDMLQWEQ